MRRLILCISLCYLLYPIQGIAQTETRIVASDLGPTGDSGPFYRFGTDVDIEGNLAIVGVPGDNVNGNSSGSVYMFEQQEGVWVETVKLTASDGGIGHSFGTAVVLLDGVALIGAPGENTMGAQAGAVYVFERTGESWEEVAKLTASNGSGGERLGASLAANGTIFIAGAPSTPFTQNSESGAAYVFEKQAEAWSEVARLEAVEPAVDDQFGASVGVSGDRVLVGAPGGEMDGGSAYVFERVDGIWEFMQQLQSSDQSSLDFFGQAVAIHERCCSGGFAAVLSQRRAERE